MRQNITKLLFLCTVALSSVLVSAQNSNVESVIMSWERASEDDTPEARHQRIEDNVTDIEAAHAHPKTANNYRMWYYRGITFLALNNEGSEEQKAKYPNALDIATESFYNSIKTDTKEKLIILSKKGLVNCAIGHYNVGVKAFNSKDYELALKAYGEVLKVYPYDEDEFLTKQAQINKETITLYSAYAASGSGNTAKAKELLQQLIDNAYGDPRIYGEMAQLLLDEKDTTGALEYIAQGREMYERDQNLMRSELDIYMKLGRTDELIEKLDKAIEIEPESAVLHFARAISYYNVGNDKEAEKSYKKVIEIDPTYSDAYFNLGVIYLDRCKPISKKIDEVSYEESLPYENQIDTLYAKAAEQFAEVMAVSNYDDAQKLDLAQNLKKLYGRLKANDKTGEYKKKYEEMKALIATLEG